MIIVVFDAMIMSDLSMVYISSFFLMTNDTMLMSYDDSSFVFHLFDMSITEAMIIGCSIFAISLYLFHGNWGDGQLVVPDF